MAVETPVAPVWSVELFMLPFLFLRGLLCLLVFGFSARYTFFGFSGGILNISPNPFKYKIIQRNNPQN